MTKLLSKKAVRERVGFSFAHIARMTSEPDYAHYAFPKPVRIGFRVFWVEHEIENWLLERIKQRS